MSHFMIVLILYINLLSLGWLKKCLFLRNMEPLSFKVSKCVQTFTNLWANSADDTLVTFFSYFFQKTGMDISGKLSLLEII